MVPRPEAFANIADAARAVGVLAGSDMPGDLLQKWVEAASTVFAADAGLDRLQDLGLSADVVVGDFDSARSVADLPVGVARHLPSQDITDCDKLLEVAAEEGFQAITLVSIEGDQLDHMLATLHSAARSALRVRLGLRTGVGWILNDGDEIVVRTSPGRRISLLPLEDAQGVNLAGVEWPLDNAFLHPLKQTSISNRTAASAVTASLRTGSAFLFAGYPPEEMPFW